MMNGMGGLIEIVLVLSLVLGWGFIEWRSNRRYKRETEEKARAEAADRHSGTSSSGGPGTGARL